MHLTNREGFKEFDIAADWYKGRAKGLSGLVRLRNEEAWCGLALESFVGWCDELIITLNDCTDRTPEIVERFRATYPDKVKVFDYPFAIAPMGPGIHDKCPGDSVHASAYFYNFTQAKSTRSHVVKLDGDMVMMDWAGAEIRALMKDRDRVKFFGTDIVGDGLRHTGCQPKCPTNGVYKVSARTFYHQGPVTQNLLGVPAARYAIDRPAFLHFKWARKDLSVATMQWPEGWQNMPHFQTIIERRNPLNWYEGEYPASVRALLDA